MVKRLQMPITMGAFLIASISIGAYRPSRGCGASGTLLLERWIRLHFMLVRSDGEHVTQYRLSDTHPDQAFFGGSSEPKTYQGSTHTLSGGDHHHLNVVRDSVLFPSALLQFTEALYGRQTHVATRTNQEDLDDI